MHAQAQAHVEPEDDAVLRSSSNSVAFSRPPSTSAFNCALSQNWHAPEFIGLVPPATVRPRTTLGIALDGNEVVALAPAGAAAQSGQLIVGDVVEEIDDVEVPITIIYHWCTKYRIGKTRLRYRAGDGREPVVNVLTVLA